MEVIRSSGEEIWRVDTFQISYYSPGIEEAKRTHPRFADWLFGANRNYSAILATLQIICRVARMAE
jgi:hypothetical protein